MCVVQRAQPRSARCKSFRKIELPGEGRQSKAAQQIATGECSNLAWRPNIALHFGSEQVSLSLLLIFPVRSFQQPADDSSGRLAATSSQSPRAIRHCITQSSARTPSCPGNLFFIRSPVSGHLLPSSSPSSSLCQRTSLELSRIAGAFSSRLLNSMKKKPICESTPVHLFLLRGRFRFFLRASHPRENNNPTNCSRAGCSPAESSGAAPLTRGLPLRQSSNTSRAMHYCSCASQPPLDMP